MAVQPLNLPGYATPQTMDFTSLANLGQVYKKAETERGLRDAFSNGVPTDAAGLAQLGAQVGAYNPQLGLSLAQLGMTAGQRQQEQERQGRLDARQLSRDAVSDRQHAESMGLQRANAARLNASPEETAAQRAQAARANGIDPTTPEGRTYVLTGKLPEGNTTVQAQTEQRKAAALSLGLTPEHPAYNGYVLTGKMPREDAQPLSATDKKAILEADEGVLSARSAIDALDKAKQLSAKAFAGPTAGARGYAASFLGETSEMGKGGIATAELNNVVVSNALSQLKAIFGGAPTEGERKILLDIQGSVSQPHEVRVKIYERARQMAEKRLQFNEQRAADMRGGSYYKPGQGGSQKQAPSQAAPSQGDPMAAARDAIKRGADPEAVRQRLQQNGIDPSGL